MDSEIFRDLVIIITGGLFLIFYILIAVLGFWLYRNIRSISKSVKATIDEIKTTSSEVKETIKSSKTLVSMIRGQSSKEEIKTR